MKAFLLVSGAILALMLLSGPSPEGIDVARLQPAQIVRISQKNGSIEVQTDTGAQGEGIHLQAALLDMSAKAPADVFLDSADYLLLSEDTLPLIDQLFAVLPPSCRVCLEEGSADLERAGFFLQAHTPNVTLLDCMVGQMELPELLTIQEEMYLVF